jgi:signal transduction histidine kinase/AraC-like DNA-binding protein
MKRPTFLTTLFVTSLLVFCQASGERFTGVTALNEPGPVDMSWSADGSAEGPEIVIAPSFRGQGWFPLPVVVSAGAVLLLLCRILVYRARQIRYRKKEIFFVSATHMIRNSLLLINTPIRELAIETDLSPRARSYLELAMEQSERLYTAVKGVIDSREADMERQQLTLSQVDIVKLASVRCLMFESLGRGRNIAIRFRCDRESFIVTADENKIENAIDSLISNALDHSRDGEEVCVKLQCFRREWMLRVRSFRKPRPVLGGTKGKTIDPNLGLILARGVVKLHRGKITCESDEGGGVDFRVTVPNHRRKRTRTRWSKRRGGEFDRPMTANAILKRNQRRPAATMDANPLDEEEIWRMVRTSMRALENVKKKTPENNAASEETRSTGANDKFLQKALEAITCNMLDPRFGKTEFASAMGVSPSLLYKKLKVLTGLSPTDFIKTVKLNYAMELLRSRRYGVTEVSELCGFSSVGYFSTVFRKNFGKSPSAI